MRISGRLCVVFAAVCYFVAETSAQPSCGGVADFGRCDGDAGGFCPSGIQCSCKGGNAFCNCPNYKGPNTDYWYMGEKCDHLWSTWDLVVMVVFPAAALAFVVAVVAQWIHFCKTPNSKTSKQKKSNETAQEEPGRNSRSINVPMSNIPPQSPQRAAAWSAPQRTNYYTEAPPAARNADYADIKRKQSRNLDKPSYGFPDQDYDVEPPRQPQQFARPAAAPLPQADYGQGGSGWGNRPFTFGRPQVNYGYE
ncbi:uncharacterized protein LOC120914373 [Rana temporaria]|uniref:uncharacterized protein LOC120914373 n=1 Tax=Rana temporaria TaxID=8407 RepID=UPI001AAC6E12|nr:uncharacterized protein LOC120914373 [Rana temporaria]